MQMHNINTLTFAPSLFMAFMNAFACLIYKKEKDTHFIKTTFIVYVTRFPYRWLKYETYHTISINSKNYSQFYIIQMLQIGWNVLERNNFVKKINAQ